MIKYTLICDQAHRFDSWFQSGAAFDALAKTKHLACAICGSTDVARALMAPSLAPSRKSTTANEPDETQNAQSYPDRGAKPEVRPDLKSPQTDAQVTLQKLRSEVEANSDYVGLSFANEARKMHDGEIPARAIFGEANLADAKKLISDGVPVAPLPFLPRRKTN